MDQELFSIKEIARALNLPTHTVRYYEKQFPDYLPVKRSTGGHRLYDRKILDRFHHIITLIKDQGLTLKGVQLHLRSNPETTDSGIDPRPPHPVTLKAGEGASGEQLITTLLRICREKSDLSRILQSYQRLRARQGG